MNSIIVQFHKALTWVFKAQKKSASTTTTVEVQCEDSLRKFMDSNVIKHELNTMSYGANPSTAEAPLWKSASEIRPALFF